MARLRLPLLSGVLALVLVLLAAGPASAHAELVGTDPPDGSILGTAPSQVTMQFTEGVSVRADGVRVLSADGARVDAGVAEASGSTVSVPLDGDLAVGSYVVAWRVISVDGHPIRGSFTFSVGAPSELSADLAETAFGSGDDERWEIAAGVLRVLAYVAALGVAGAVLVGDALRREGEPTPVGRATTIAAAVGLLSVLGQVLVQGALATGQGLGAISQPGVFDLAVADGVGLTVLVVGAGLVAVAVCGGLPFVGPVRTTATVGAAIVPLGFAISGHTRSLSPAAVGYVADAIHLAAGAVWFGGLVAVAAAVRRRREAADSFGAAEAVATFSGLAAVLAALVVVTGSVLAWILVGDLDALRTTTYGKVLTAKVALVALVLAMAGWNRFRLVPRVAAAAMAAHPAEAADDGDDGDDGDGGPSAPEAEPVVDDPRAWAALRGSILAEVAVVVVALSLTGALVNITPAETAARGGPVTVEAPLGDGTVEVEVTPADPGRNDVHVYLYDATGNLDRRYEEIGIQLALPSADLGPFDRAPVEVAGGHFQLVGTDLPIAGEWTLTVTVKPDRFTEQTAEVTFAIG